MNNVTYPAALTYFVHTPARATTKEIATTGTGTDVWPTTVANWDGVWNVEKVRSMVCAFSNCPFEQDIDSWNPKSIEHGGFTKTFYSCALKEKKKLPKWYKARL